MFNSQNESALDSEHGTPQATTPTGVNTGISAHPQKASFSSQRFRAHRPSRVSNWRSIADEELLLSPSGGGSDKPPIPSALPQHGESHVSPLPILPMIVLSIVSRFNYPRVEYGSKCVVGHAWRVSLCKRINSIPLIYGERCNHNGHHCALMLTVSEQDLVWQTTKRVLGIGLEY